jgi:hypothetical protein
MSVSVVGVNEPWTQMLGGFVYPGLARLSVDRYGEYDPGGGCSSRTWAGGTSRALAEVDVAAQIPGP